MMEPRDRAYHAVIIFSTLVTGIGLMCSGLLRSDLLSDRRAAEEIGLLAGYPLLLIAAVTFVLLLGRRLRLIMDSVAILLLTAVGFPGLGVGLFGKMLPPIAAAVIGAACVAVSVRPLIRDVLPCFRRQEPHA